MPKRVQSEGDTPRLDHFTDISWTGNLSPGAQARVTNDLIPATDNAEDLGTTALRWRRLYAATLSPGSLNNILFVDGVTYTTIQAAYDALPAAGGVVWDRRDGSTITDTLDLTTAKPAHVILARATYTPTGGQFVSIPAGWDKALWIQGAIEQPQYVTVTGTGTVMSNTTNAVNTIDIANAVGVRISGINFQGSTSTGAHIKIAGGATPLAAAQIFIERNSFNGKDNAVSATGVVFQLHVDRNNMVSQNAEGFLMAMDGGATNININVTRNWIKSSGGDGIKLSGADGASIVVIEKNAISDISAANKRGINMTQCSAVRIRDNDVENITGTGTSDGMIVSGEAYSIEGNLIQNAKGTNGAIYGSSLTLSTIGNNRLLKGTSTATYAITLDSASLTTDVATQQSDFPNPAIRNGVAVTPPFFGNAVSLTKSAGTNTTPDVFGDGTNALVLGGKSDGSGIVRSGATSSWELYLISKYKDIATVSNGIPAEIATVDLTAQGAAITTTNLNSATLAAGQYRVSWNAKVTTPATTGAATSTLGALTIVYTDPDAVVQTITAPATIAAGTIATSSTGNSTTTVLLGMPLVVNAKASTNITYAMAYVSDAAGEMRYNLHILLECL